MRWLISSGLRLRALVVAAVVALLGVGLVQLRGARVDAYPEFTEPAVQIQAEALGLSAQEVEQLVTVPLEQDLLNGTPWVKHIRSTSMPGLAAIDLVFQPGTNLYRARQMVQERMTQAKALPNVGTPPIMVQPLASTSRIAMIGMTSKSLSTMQMSVLALWQIRPRLMSIPGVANVSIWGQRNRQLQVQVDPRRLQAHNVTLTQLVESTGNALWVSPLSFVEASTPGTGGFVESPNQRLGVQHISPISTAKQLSTVAVEGAAGSGMRIGDVATVREDSQPLIGDASVGGAKQSLMLVVERFPGANTATVTRNVEAAMKAMGPGMSGITVDTQLFRPASYLRSGLHSLGLAALAGFVLMLLVTGLLTVSWRRTLIVAAVVPLSLVTATYVLYLRGSTLTSMTLLGLAMAAALVVDDAVGDVTAAFGEWAARNRDSVGPDGNGPDAASAAVLRATLARRAPLVYATIVTLLLAAPVLLASGVAGALARSALATYALALLVSMAVAILITPTLALLLLPKRGGLDAADSRRRRLAARFSRRVDRLTEPFFARRLPAAAAAVVLFALGLAVVPQLRSGHVLPQLQDRDVLVRLQAAPGTALPEMRRITESVAAEVGRLPGVRTTGSHVGRAIGADEIVDVDSGEIWAKVAPGADYGATLGAVRTAVRGYPGLRSSVGTYAADRIAAADNADDAGPGTRKDLVVRVYGPDYGTLRGAADDVSRLLTTVPGVLSPRVAVPPSEPTVEVEVNLAAAQRHGLRPGDVRRDASTLISGLTVGSLYEQQKIFDVVVWGGPAQRHSVTSLDGLMLDTPSGGHVRLGDVAHVRIRSNPVAVQHDEVSRSLEVTADVRGRDPGAVGREVTSRLRGLQLPYEYRAEVLGDAASTSASHRRVVLAAAVVAVLILLLLQAATGSWRGAALLMVTAPLAAVGVVLAAPLIGGIRSAAALAAAFAVVALATRQSLVLLRRAQDRVDGGNRDSALRSAARAMVLPVLGTAAATAAALAPAAAMGDGPGLELLHPFAVTGLAGLVTAAVVVLLVVPALYPALASAGADPLAAPAVAGAGGSQPAEAARAEDPAGAPLERGTLPPAGRDRDEETWR